MIHLSSNGFPVQMGVRSTMFGTTFGLNHDARSERNVALRYIRPFGTDTSFPEGFNSQDARDMPHDESASMAITFYGRSILTAAGLTAETGEVTFDGEGFATFDGELGVNGAVTFEGEGLVTATGRTAEVGRVTMDAGARPSAFDIAQEIVSTSADGSVSIGQAFKLFLAALVGKVSGAGTPTIVFRDVNDTKDRIVASVDADGNRTAVTKDVS